MPRFLLGFASSPQPTALPCYFSYCGEKANGGYFCTGNIYQPHKAQKSQIEYREPDTRRVLSSLLTPVFCVPFVAKGKAVQANKEIYPQKAHSSQNEFLKCAFRSNHICLTCSHRARVSRRSKASVSFVLFVALRQVEFTPVKISATQLWLILFGYTL